MIVRVGSEPRNHSFYKLLFFWEERSLVERYLLLKSYVHNRKWRGVRRPMRSAPSWLPSPKWPCIWSQAQKAQRGWDLAQVTQLNRGQIQLSFSWQEGAGVHRAPSPSQAGTGCPSCSQPEHPEATLSQGLVWPTLAPRSPGDPEWRLPGNAGVQTEGDSPWRWPLPLFPGSLQSGARRSLNWT